MSEINDSKEISDGQFPVKHNNNLPIATETPWRYGLIKNR